MPRLVSLLGLGFGDCGKGLFTDFLTRHWQAHSVVRCNGGAQAGHNVVLPDGRHHTFSQFGSGSFVAGVTTVLAAPVVVHPTALLVEEQALRRAGVHDALDRLLIDGRCRVTTPFHQAAGRLRELARGDAAHGTCGVGVGETVGHGQRHPDAVLEYADLNTPARARGQLEAIRRTLRAELESDGAFAGDDPRAASERRIFTDEGIAGRWLAIAVELVRRVPPASREAIGERLGRPGTVLFEGAQGVLLDEWAGFHPHTSWGRIHPDAVAEVAADLGLSAPIVHLGVLRSYLTRHGRGPLPTFDPALDSLAEPHNDAAGWQGHFRRGHPDAVLLRYALAALGRLDGILLSHLDRLGPNQPFAWCEAYRLPTAGEGQKLTELPPGGERDLAHRHALTQLLNQAIPQYDPEPLTTAASCIARIEAVARCPVWFGSWGPNWRDVRRLSAIVG